MTAFKFFQSLLGLACALLTLEICLRPFISPALVSSRQSFEQRQYREGIAVSHFAPDGARETGNTKIPNGETWLVFGDSHVEAIQVRDEATMGSVIERLARANKRTLNVKQYGWSQVAAPMYIAESGKLLANWNPSNVIVTLNRTDLGTEPLQSALHWRMSIHPDLSITLINVDEESNANDDNGFRQWLRRRNLTPSSLANVTAQKSSLMHALVTRFQELASGEQRDLPNATVATNKHDAQELLVPRASVCGLKAAYGNNLLIVYLPDVGAVDGERPDDVESSLLDSCQAEGVRCLSMRASMIRERDIEHKLCRGFENTAPGLGHLNETGHFVVASEIWRAVSEK